MPQQENLVNIFVVMNESHRHWKISAVETADVPVNSSVRTDELSLPQDKKSIKELRFGTV